MDRRDFLTSFQAKPTGQDFSHIDRTMNGLTPYSGTWGTDEVTHLLKRTMFGAAVADVNYFKTKTLTQAIDELINGIVADPLPPINNYNDKIADPDVPAGETWVNAAHSKDGTINNQRTNSLTSWWIGLQLNQGRSITEKMVLFWHNHFVTERPNINPAGYLYKYNALLRTHALGNFKDFTKQITLNPAMLVYLNGNVNVKSAPDENYGRELQELFTMGKGPDSKYTEDDVKAAAKVLTGYKDDIPTHGYIFNPNKHDTNDKKFSAFYNNTVIKGQTGVDGEKELEALLDMLFAQNEVALFICRKLYRFFVYYTIDGATEANVIVPLATIFRNNNYNIRPVLAALFSSEHFFDPLNRACVIKNPADFTVGLCREFNVVFPDAKTDYVNAYNLWNFVYTISRDMNQEMGNPPNVAGWPAYYQEPQYHELWINSDTLPKRNRFSDTMIANGYTKSGKKLVIDPIAFALTLSEPGNPNTLISDSLNLLYLIDVSQNTKDYLKTQVLLSGQSSDAYWTKAWDNYISDTTNTSYKNIVLTRLRALYKYIMDLSEYQLS
ncbi:MAG TPA: DUF1800 domain-containing protein [Bacteroidia bacterium]|nr:DUF1800 domain-containing protein [Bacteroidia bacterium]